MVRKYREKHRFIVYEVWENAEMFKRFLSQVYLVGSDYTVIHCHCEQTILFNFSHDDSVVRKTFKDACSKHIKKIDQFELPGNGWYTNGN